MQGQRLVILVRKSKKESAQHRIESILQFWEQQSESRLPRPVIVQGDLRQNLCGLSARDQHWVAKNCDSVLHSAASLAFHEDSSGEPWLTNIHGTKHLLDLTKTCGIRSMHYVSTAYVCGLRQGAILESELECGQDFRNDYESSKLQAEVMVRNADHLRSLTVYRPAVIAGDSQTGYTNTYHGIYLYLRLMALLVPRHAANSQGIRVTKLRMPMTGNERRNVIPIDWASQVISHLYRNDAANGYTFHLAPEVALTPRDVVEAGYSYFNSTGVEYVGDDPIDPQTYNEFESQFLPGLELYNNYKSTDPVFDCTNTKRFARDLPCPKIDEAMLHRYIRFGEQDRWGKRNSKRPKVDCSATE
jgi:nucleoside-diphosphate-sugar epimerase